MNNKISCVMVTKRLDSGLFHKAIGSYSTQSKDNSVGIIGEVEMRWIEDGFGYVCKKIKL